MYTPCPLTCHSRRQPSDIEVFSFTAGTPGAATLSMTGVQKLGTMVRSNLNASLTLASATGAVMASTAGVGIPAFSVQLPAAGLYYVYIAPVGAGDPVTDGYSTYGSRGQYEVSVTYPVSGDVPSSPSPSPVVSAC